MRLRGPFSSLRWRLTFLYVGLLAGLLVLLGGIQYVALREALIRGDVDLLRNDFNDSYDLFEKIQAPPAPTPSARSSPRPSAAPTPRPSATPTIPPVRAGKLSQEFADEVATRRISVRLFDAKGHLKFEAPLARDLPGGTERPSIPLLAFADYERGLHCQAQDHYLASNPRSTSFIVVLERIPRPPRSQRSRTACDPAERNVQGLAQLSIATDDMEQVLARDRFLYLFGSLAILFLALLLSPLITARALRPLERMGRTAAALASGDYKQRVNLPQRSDEVGKLARAFDEMADRIDQAFEVRRQSEERMRQFVGDASHELRTPLTALGGYLDVLLRQSPFDAETLQSALAAMQRESTRMNRLVNDLLQLARIEGGRALKEEPVALDSLVGQTLDEMSLAVPVARQLEPANVLGDAEALKQVVANLAQNAVKYAPGAKQDWACFSVNGTVTLRVHDHGPGISATDLPHVFERFYRGEKMRGRDQGGSGLGLAIVKSIVEAQGGHVEASSPPGEGATFTIILPAQA